MSEQDKEVNEYGMTDAEYEVERKAARAAVRGEAPTEEKVEQQEEKKEPAVVETQLPAKEEVETQDVDPLTYVPEEHREKIASLLKVERERASAAEHRAKSDQGRQEAYQRKYEEARRAQAELEAKVAAQSKTPPKSLQELSPRFKEIAEEDENLVATFEDVREQIRKEMREEMETRIKAATQPLYDREQQEAQRHQEQAQNDFTRTLDEKVGNWREVVYAFDEHGKIKTDDKGVPVFSDSWAHFIQDQPPAFQAAYVNPQTTADALRAFEDYSSWGTKNGYFEPEKEPEAKLPNADAIKEKRNNDLKKVAPPKTTSVPLQQTQSMDLSDPVVEARERRLAREAIAKGDPSIFFKR